MFLVFRFLLSVAKVCRSFGFVVFFVQLTLLDVVHVGGLLQEEESWQHRPNNFGSCCL